jgi:hypothetical protein
MTLPVVVARRTLAIDVEISSVLWNGSDMGISICFVGFLISLHFNVDLYVDFA